MRYRRKTAEEAAWLAEAYPGMPDAQLIDAFERRFGWRLSPSALATWASRRGLRKDARSVRWREHPEYDAFLREYVPGHSDAETAAEFMRRFGACASVSQVKNRKHALGLRSGTVGGRFRPGQPGWNKGMRQAEFMSPEGLERVRGTQFRKGSMPANATDKPIGYERVTKDGYVEVKVAERPSSPDCNDNFRAKQRLVWEQANGRALGPGEMVVFADGDKRNFDPGNLVAMRRDEHAAIVAMGVRYADRETCLSAVALARLRMGVTAAECRPRPCAACGAEFAPRYARQRRCDACIEAGRRPLAPRKPKEGGGE